MKFLLFQETQWRRNGREWMGPPRSSNWGPDRSRDLRKSDEDFFYIEVHVNIVTVLYCTVLLFSNWRFCTPPLFWSATPHKKQRHHPRYPEAECCCGALPLLHPSVGQADVWFSLYNHDCRWRIREFRDISDEIILHSQHMLHQQKYYIIRKLTTYWYLLNTIAETPGRS